jgi:hypothetical protein
MLAIKTCVSGGFDLPGNEKDEGKEITVTLEINLSFLCYLLTKV